MQLCRISGYHRLSYSILQSYFFSFFRSLKLKTKKYQFHRSHHRGRALSKTFSPSAGQNVGEGLFPNAIVTTLPTDAFYTNFAEGSIYLRKSSLCEVLSLS